jgi:hypothetical protein
MPVEQVHVPGKIREVSPKVPEEKREDSAEYWEKQVKAKRAQKEYEALGTPPEPPEPPFKVTGGINLGNIDLQEQQRQAREEATQQRAEFQKRIEAADKAATDAREALNNANLVHLKENLSAQIQALQNAITSSGKRDIVSELDTVETLAGKLGLQRNPIGKSDWDGQLQLEKFKLDQKREDRKYMLELKRDERMWQLELKKLEQSAKESEARAEAERSKYAFMASLPEQLGSTIAKGMLARGTPAAGPAISGQPGPQERAAPAAPAVRTIEAGEGESGEIQCPACGTSVGIGPTAANAVCVKCHQKFVIRRIEPQQVESEPAEMPSRTQPVEVNNESRRE